jgi:type II secretory pathway pseudopilin PulG
MRIKLPTDRLGFKASSLFEVLVTVCVIGIVAAMAVGSLQDIMPASKRTIALHLVETLNTAVDSICRCAGRISSEWRLSLTLPMMRSAC